MKHSILITSLNGRDAREGLQYFCFSDGEKNMYCDALTSAEAGSKFILANHSIDLILAFGSKSSYDDGDDLKTMLLCEGQSLYESDNKDMSSYGLYRYRLAEFLDEVNAEIQDVRELLDEDQRNSAAAFIKQYFNETVNTDGNHKFNRFFDRLVREDDLRADMESRVYEAAMEAGADPEKYLEWIRNYIYYEFKDTSKMQLLDCNEDVQIRFVSSGDSDDDEQSFTDLLIRNIENIHTVTDYKAEEVDVYLCLQNDNTRDTFVLTSLMETIKSMPASHIKVQKMVLSDSPSDEMTVMISDDTGKLGVYDILSATRAFLRYGKTDMFLDFRNEAGLTNPDIDRVLYAMRNIDIGISLCDITDIERGIVRLREFFSEDYEIKGDTFAEQYFNVIARGIREDYGPLLNGEEIEFIELAKWAYRKGFWQQALTLIESRAPRDFVKKGIFYYCDSEETKPDIVAKFGKLQFEMKSFEKYKLDDVEHYYIKLYNRWNAPRARDSREAELELAKTRVGEIDRYEDDFITAHSICPDHDALTNLLFAYYHLSTVRNNINHAADEFGGFASIKPDSDVSERMNLIKQATEYFIHCYEIVAGLISEIERPNVVIIQGSEVSDYAKSLRRPRDDFRSKDGDRRDDRRDDHRSGGDGGRRDDRRDDHRHGGDGGRRDDHGPKDGGDHGFEEGGDHSAEEGGEH